MLCRAPPPLPRQVVQWGAPRTATALQFQILCAIAFLVRHDSSTAVRCQYRGSGGSVPPPAANRYDVFKFHERPAMPTESTRERLWVIATGLDADWNTTVDQRDAIESHLGWPVHLTQQPAELRRRGWEHFATKYADAFRLTMPQREALVEYTRHWEVLRRCCGTQMSSSWRAALQGAAADGRAHACAAHDLDAVEAALMTTEVYRRFGARDKHLRSLSLRDGDLNGSYCRWANEQVGRRSLAFNADLSGEWTTS